MVLYEHGPIREGIIMDVKTMTLRLEQWMPIFEAQAKSGMGKDEWCRANGIRKWEFYKRQRECRQYLIERSEAGKDLPVPADNLPSFFELPAAKPSEGIVPVAVESVISDPIDSKPVAAESVKEGSINIAFGKFKIKLSGQVDTATLTTLIKAVSDA